MDTSGRTLKPQIAAFRHISVPNVSEKPHVVWATWRSLLPGTAQLWYRLKVSWCRHWPHKLLQIVREDLSWIERAKVAVDLLGASPCCLGSGGSMAKDLKLLAERLFHAEEDRVAFLLGSWCRRILTMWAAVLSPSIADLECSNAWLKRAHSSGRPQNLATLAVKKYLKDNITEFYRVHGRQPVNKFAETIKCVECLLPKPPKKIRRKSCAYDAFRLEYAEARRLTHVGPLPLGSSPEGAFDIGIAYGRLTPIEREAYALKAAQSSPSAQVVGAREDDANSAATTLVAHRQAYQRSFKQVSFCGESGRGNK